jgi:hypothetical protein
MEGAHNGFMLNYPAISVNLVVVCFWFSSKGYQFSLTQIVKQKKSRGPWSQLAAGRYSFEAHNIKNPSMGANRVARPRWPKDVDPVVKIKCRNPFFVEVLCEGLNPKPYRYAQNQKPNPPSRRPLATGPSLC